ncbi:hypothetical protein NECAME_07682 [Necator americanus]|uniref:Uncharacterized protein n=1 Tax=Necator americanus TaxID=51031 RepID=W2TP44_NECAM|nr:hypothetical protein NECAME_07682 [Necator americanus]ETN82906.1 hypothetical protein NECAME_07682 [Necator americanus]
MLEERRKSGIIISHKRALFQETDIEVAENLISDECQLLDSWLAAIVATKRIQPIVPTRCARDCGRQ